MSPCALSPYTETKLCKFLASLIRLGEQWRQGISLQAQQGAIRNCTCARASADSLGRDSHLNLVSDCRVLPQDSLSCGPCSTFPLKSAWHEQSEQMHCCCRREIRSLGFMYRALLREDSSGDLGFRTYAASLMVSVPAHVICNSFGRRSTRF